MKRTRHLFIRKLVNNIMIFHKQNDYKKKPINDILVPREIDMGLKA